MTDQTRRAILLELAERCEREEPSRELDSHIYAGVVVKGTVVTVGPPTYDNPRYFASPTKSKINWIGYDLLNVSPKYTSSLDAAVGLVPAGDWWRVGASIVGEASAGVCGSYGELDAAAKTPALALCAAALRALAAMEE